MREPASFSTARQADHRHQQRTVLQRLSTVGLAILLSACSAQRMPRVDAIDTAPRSAEAIPAGETLKKAYLDALDVTRQPGPELISSRLLPILTTTPGLLWNKHGEVRMVTWTRRLYYRTSGRNKYRRGEVFPLYGDTWFLVAPFVRRTCRSLKVRGAPLDLRLKQLIGLPPDDAKDAFLEVWIDPADLFRPCLDPEITDRSCQPAPGTGESDEPPWACPIPHENDSPLPDQAAEHRQWLCKTWHNSFDNPEPYANFPWTALGYTYDWGRPDNPRGLSELVARRGTKVRFHALRSTERYCR